MKTKRFLHILLFLSLSAGMAHSQTKTVNLIFIGNSITEASYLQAPPPTVTARILEKQNYTVHYTNCGISGTTTYDYLPPGKTLFGKITQAADSFYQKEGLLIFSIKLGTNDSAIKGPTGAPVAPETYRKNLRMIIQELHTRYPEAIFVLHRPLWYSPTTHNSAMYLQEGLSRLETYSPELKQLVKEHPDFIYRGDQKGFGFFRKHHLTHHNPQQGNSGTFYLHPNQQGAEILGEFWGAALLKVIQQHTKKASKSNK
ncbi:MAG: GDSL-type esterase/lipase family protein [Tannerellaceae bacterium]|nr:GDSL-type esterase/lipase family protein [Tannerellaceae bacterium]